MNKRFNLRPKTLANNVFSFTIKREQKAAMNKQDVLMSIKTAIMNYPDFGSIDDKDIALLSQAPNGQVFDKSLIILLSVKTHENKENFFRFIKFVESNSDKLGYKFKVKFLTQKSDVVNVKLFNKVGDFAELLGVEQTIEQD